MTNIEKCSLAIVLLCIYVLLVLFCSSLNDIEKRIQHLEQVKQKVESCCYASK